MNAFLDVSSLLTDMMTFWKHRKNIAKARQWLDLGLPVLFLAVLYNLGGSTWSLLQHLEDT